MMKFKIPFLTIIIISACMHMHASEKQPSSVWQRAQSRLDAAHGKIAPELPQTAPKALPTLQDVVAPAESETSFIATMRGYLSRFTGCLTWHESCKCPEFDEPITCEGMLKPCMQELKGCTQENLDNMLSKAIDRSLYSYANRRSHYPEARCRIISLICQGADPNTGFHIALGQAVKYNDPQLVSFLLKHKANANLSGWAPNFPIHYAANSPRIMQELINNDADITQLDNHGQTALHYAMHPAKDFDMSPKDGNADTVEILIKNGIDVNAGDKYGDPALTRLAVRCTHYDEIETESIQKKARLLVQAGATTHYKDGFFKGTAQQIARHFESHKPCRALADFLQEYEKQPSRVQD